jgi:hypothetical protein
MRRATHLAIILVAAAALIAATLLFWSPERPPRQATIREIIANPDSFDDVVVVVSVSALESAPDGRTLSYRRLLNRPPLLVIEFADPLPGRRPSHVVGRVVTGNPIRIIDCRPAP